LSGRLVERVSRGYHLFQHLDHYSGYVLSAWPGLCSVLFPTFDPLNDRRTLHEIIPRLHLSNRYGAWDYTALTTLGITHILIAGHGSGLRSYFPDEFSYMQLELHDDTNEAAASAFFASLPVSVRFIEDALAESPNNHVLVHCSQGVSRSAGIIAAYLIQEYQMNSEDALDRIRARRPWAEPNAAFVQQLERWNSQIRKKLELADKSPLDSLSQKHAERIH
jgi:protein-tyrosine phosphatase